MEPSVGGASDTEPMTPDDAALLEFESQHPRNDRVKEAAIWETFGHSWVRYQQRLLRLTHDQAAVATYPLVCARVQRVSRRQGVRA